MPTKFHTEIIPLSNKADKSFGLINSCLSRASKALDNLLDEIYILVMAFRLSIC